MNLNPTSAEEQFTLGLKYTLGEDVPKSHGEAVSWFIKAAKQGHSGAQYYIGLAYELGRGVIEDKREAVNWFSKAAAQGEVLAQERLGLISMEDIARNIFKNK